MNEYELGKDIQELRHRISELEKKLSCQCSSDVGGVKDPVLATDDKPDDYEVGTLVFDPDGTNVGVLSCRNGTTRQKTVGGVCYCQMCCGNTWYYINRSDGTLRCGDRRRTEVDCGGQTFIGNC